jgi:hypothetical protein
VCPLLRARSTLNRLEHKPEAKQVNYRKIDSIRRRWPHVKVFFARRGFVGKELMRCAQSAGEGITTRLCRGSAKCAAPGQATRQFGDLPQHASWSRKRHWHTAQGADRRLVVTGCAAPATTPARYLVAAAYCVSSLRMILPPFITNLTC